MGLMRRIVASAALVLAFSALAPLHHASAQMAGQPAEYRESFLATTERLSVDLDRLASQVSQVTLVDVIGGVYDLEYEFEPGGVSLVFDIPDGVSGGEFELSWDAVDEVGEIFSGTRRVVFATPSEVEVRLGSSFPRPGSALSFPPRESRFSFTAEVDASDFSARLVTVRDGLEEDVQRLSSGRVQDVLLRIPVLSPGDYRIEWSLGAGMSGSVPFSIAQPLVAAGGGNHRHSTDDLFIESFASWFPRASVLVLAGVLFGMGRRSRRVEPSFNDVMAVRVSGGVLAVLSLVGVASAAVEGLIRWGDHPLFAVLASDVVWVYLMASALGVVLGVSGRPGRFLTGSSLALAGLVWSVGPALQFRYGPAVPVVSLLLYLATVAFSSELYLSLRGAVRAWRPVAALWVSAALSSILLFATAQSMELRGAFASRFSVQVVVTLAALAVSLLWLRASSFPARLRYVLAAALLGAAALGLWVPPPAPGL